MTENNAAQFWAIVNEITNSDECGDIPSSHVERVVTAALSKLRAEGVQAGEPVADTVVRQCPRCTGNGTILRLSGIGPAAYDVQEECPNCEGAGVVASAPVAGEALNDLQALQWALKHPDGIRGVIADAQRFAAPQAIEPQHPDDAAVDRFAVAMKAKLAKKRLEGRGGWEDKEQCGASFLSQLLREHVEKGNPLDVGNLAMMLHQRGEAILAAPQASAEWVLFEHDDGGMAAAPSADAATFTVNDPAWHRFGPVTLMTDALKARATIKQSLNVAPQASVAVRILFPAHLRKMWSGGEVQAWLDNRQGITPPTASAKGSLEHYRKWQAEPSEADKDGAHSKSPDQLRGCAWSDS